MVDKLVGILKSNGKLGGAGLMLLGLAYTGLIAWGKVGGSIEVSMGNFFAGLGPLPRSVDGNVNPSSLCGNPSSGWHPA
jgi:hypothetical protein